MKLENFNCIATFEPSNPKREISQCIKCQRYDHTKSFWYRKERCVKLAGDHPTSNYPRKDKSKDVKCALYKGSVPTQTIMKTI